MKRRLSLSAIIFLSIIFHVSAAPSFSCIFGTTDGTTFTGKFHKYIGANESDYNTRMYIVADDVSTMSLWNDMEEALYILESFEQTYLVVVSIDDNNDVEILLRANHDPNIFIKNIGNGFTFARAPNSDLEVMCGYDKFLDNE